MASRGKSVTINSINLPKGKDGGGSSNNVSQLGAGEQQQAAKSSVPGTLMNAAKGSSSLSRSHHKQEKKQISQLPVDGVRDFETQELRLLNAIRSRTIHAKNKNCTKHNFCGQEIRLLEQTENEDNFPITQLKKTKVDGDKDKETPPIFKPVNFPQRFHTLKQRLLLEGKVRAKEGEFQGASMMVPTHETMMQWIEQSKNYGNTLSFKDRKGFTSPSQQSQTQVHPSPQQPMANNMPALMGAGAVGMAGAMIVVTGSDAPPTPATKPKPTPQTRLTGLNIPQQQHQTTGTSETQRSNRFQLSVDALRVNRMAAPSLPINPNLVKLGKDEAYLSHVNYELKELTDREKDKGRSGLVMQSSLNADQQGETTSKKKHSSKYPTYAQILKEQAERAIEEEQKQKAMDEAEKLRPVTLIRSQQGYRFIKKVPQGNQAMRQELENQRAVIEVHKQMRASLYSQENMDPSGENGILNAQKPGRGQSSQPELSSPRTGSNHPFGNRDRSRTHKKIEKHTAKLYDVYEAKRLASAKERLRKMNVRSAWSQGPGTDSNPYQNMPTQGANITANDTVWSVKAEPQYEYDLRKQLTVEGTSDNIVERRRRDKLLHEKQQKWKGMVAVQDQWEILRRRADEQLVNISTKLNPLYDMKDLRKDHHMARTKDYIKEDCNAKPRVTLVQKKGMEQRVELYKEELRAYEFMLAKGYVEEAKTKEDLIAAIQKFKQMTSKHPERDVDAAIKRLQANDPANKRRKATQESDEEEEMVASSVHKTASQDAHKVDSGSDPAAARADSREEGLSPTSLKVGQQLSSNVSKEGARSSTGDLNGVQALSSSSKKDDFGNQQLSQSRQETTIGSVSGMKDDHTAANTTLAADTRSKIRTNKSLKSSSMPRKVDTYMDPEFWYHKGVVLNQNDQALKSALKCYKQALKLNPEHTPSIFNLACNYQKNKEPKLAKAQFEKAIKVREDWPDAYYGLTLTCIELEQTGEAVNAIEKAIHYTDPNNVPTQILYVRALAYKVDNQLDKALEHYKVIMKDENTIWDFYKMIQKANEEIRMQNQMADPASLHWEVDLLNTFKQSGMLKEYEPSHYINFWQYYEANEGWSFDKIPQVLNLLQKMRFFGRFEADQLQRLLTKVTLKTVKKGTLLFLADDEAAVIVAGQLYLFNHSKDVACPSVQAIFNPGDILGIKEITNNWTRQQHDWMVARNDCDIFVCSKEYMSFMWHIMKKGLQNKVVEMCKISDGLSTFSEQTLYSIAYDMAEFKEFEHEETIVHQDRKSCYNVNYLKNEVQAITNLRDKDKEFRLDQKLTQRCNYPTLKQAWDEREVKNNWDEYLIKKRRDEELAKATGAVKKKAGQIHVVGARMGTATTRGLTTEDSVSEDCNTTVRGGQNPLSGSKRSAIASPKMLSEDELKQMEDQDKVLQVKRDFAARADRDYRICQNQISRLGQIQDQIAQYQMDKKALPGDADGIYVIVGGNARICNKSDNEGFGVKLGPGDHFGFSKFILAQGYSYFGDIIAHKEPSEQSNQISKDSKAKQQRQLTNQNSLAVGAMGRLKSEGRQTQGSKSKTTADKGDSQGQADSKKIMDQSFTTCVFIPQNRLHLIPFYDLYALRELMRTHEDFVKLRHRIKDNIDGYLKNKKKYVSKLYKMN